MDKESIISKLKESLEKNYGDEGRTRYIIEKLQSDRQLPKSDHLYIERMIKLCEPEIKEPKVISKVSTSDLVKCHICDSSIKLDEKSIRKNGFWLHEKCFEKIPSEKLEPKVVSKVSTSDLVKCNVCDSSIKLDEKSIRKNGFWLHEKCFEKIPSEKLEPKVVSKVSTSDLVKCNVCDSSIKLDEKSIRKNGFWLHEKCFEKIPIIKIESPITETEILQKAETIPKVIRQPVKIKPKATYAQMAFSGGLLASLVGSVYFLAGEMLSVQTGLWGSVLYLAVYRKELFTSKKRDSQVVKTGIPGFDPALSVGLKKNSSVVVSGPPGSGKTTFGLQFVYSGAKDFDEPGVYISLSQSIDEIKNDCKAFGWDIDDLIAKGKILMIDLRSFKIKDKIIEKDDSLYRGEQIPFEHLTKFIQNSIKKIKAKRIVIDSISILGMQYSDKFYMRQGLQGMIQSLENFDVTSLLISEFSENNKVPLEWLVTSGIIQLDNQITDKKMKRTIKITKLRGMKHSDQVHSLELGSNGLYVYEN